MFEEDYRVENDEYEELRRQNGLLMAWSIALVMSK